MSFNDGESAQLREATVGVSAGWRAARWVTLSASTGVLAGGTLLPAGGPQLTLRPGPFGAVAATFRLLEGGKGRPFATATASVSALFSRTLDGQGGSASFVALDGKVSAILGMTFWDRFNPYVGAAVFGGPVFWSSGGARTTGTDTHHYQVLLGASLALPKGFDVFVEGSPLGEVSLSAGVGYAL